MLPTHPKKNPAGGPGHSKAPSIVTHRKSNTLKLPRNWRDRLPSPDFYYASIDKLGRPNASGWAQGICPFHDDHDASLSVCFADARGHWRCFAGCGHGDLIAFHQRMTGLPFVQAVADLIGGRA